MCFRNRSKFFSAQDIHIQILITLIVSEHDCSTTPKIWFDMLWIFEIVLVMAFQPYIFHSFHFVSHFLTQYLKPSILSSQQFYDSIELVKQNIFRQKKILEYWLSNIFVPSLVSNRLNCEYFYQRQIFHL